MPRLEAPGDVLRAIFDTDDALSNEERATITAEMLSSLEVWKLRAVLECVDSLRGALALAIREKIAEQ